jgi:Uma2 family endonuclease
VLGGELIVSKRPPRRHALLASLFGAQLCDPFDRGLNGGPGGWWILDEPPILFGRDVLVPDLAGWQRARMEEFPRSLPVEVVPDWVGEVLWPGTAALDRTRKLPLYAKAGVSHVWLIDPMERSLEVYRSEDGRCVLAEGFSGDGPFRASPFQAVELAVERLWRSAER